MFKKLNQPIKKAFVPSCASIEISSKAALRTLRNLMSSRLSIFANGLPEVCMSTTAIVFPWLS